MRHTTVIAAAIVSVPLLLAAQQPRPDNQPGRLWTEPQLREASSHVRAGRSLNPKTWPNGARVAVALTFNVNNSANQIARGDTAVVAMTGGEFGAVQGLARVHEVLDAVSAETSWALGPVELGECLEEAYAAQARLAELRVATYLFKQGQSLPDALAQPLIVQVRG